MEKLDLNENLKLLLCKTKHMERYSSLTINEMQIKSTMRHHYTTYQNGKNKKTVTNRMLVKMWGNQIIHTFLVGKFNGTALCKRAQLFIMKLSVQLS